MSTWTLSLGLVEYTEALELQNLLVAARKQGSIPDLLLLLRHPNVITLGRSKSKRFLRHSEAELRQRGYQVIEAGRGGEVTFHGPGQLIAYPILSLQDEERDLHLHLRRLEEVGIEVCRHYGVNAGRVDGRTGVWTKGKKLAAIGVRARHWITFHGMAFNLSPELEGFDLIVPCGISDAEVTCLHKESHGVKPGHDELEQTFLQAFGSVFERELVTVSHSKLESVLQELSNEEHFSCLAQGTPGKH